MTRRRPEARLEAEVLLALGRDPAVAVYKNEVGAGYYGNVLPQIRQLLRGTPHLRPVEQILYRSRLVYGLGVGSPDLVGIGRGGRFVGLELKVDHIVTPEQLQWHEAARARGAKVEIVRSVEDAWGVVRG